MNSNNQGDPKSDRQLLAEYYTLYGGLGEVLKSGYFHVACLLTIVCIPLWTASLWWNLVINVIPSLIGFTLGGYAILVAFGDDKFRRIIAGSEKTEPSPFKEVNVTFFHFILVQVTALGLAVVASSRPVQYFVGVLGLEMVDFGVSRTILGYVYWGFSFLIFSYSITLILAATLAVYRVSSWFDQYIAVERTKDAITQDSNTQT